MKAKTMTKTLNFSSLSRHLLTKSQISRTPRLAVNKPITLSSNVLLRAVERLYSGNLFPTYISRISRTMITYLSNSNCSPLHSLHLICYEYKIYTEAIVTAEGVGK